VVQGADPSYTVGRAGVAGYYDKRPFGLRAVYLVREIRSLDADASCPSLMRISCTPMGQSITHLTLVLIRSDDRWLIRHYHVSKATESRRD